MEFKVFSKPVNGAIPVTLQIDDRTDDVSSTIYVELRVPYSDSRAAIEKATKDAALSLLKRVVLALESQSHPPQSE